MIRHFLRDTRGNFAAAMAVMIVPLSLVIGLGVDLGSALSRQSRLQAAADAAALAAVRQAEGNSAGGQESEIGAMQSAQSLVPSAEEYRQEFSLNFSSPAPRTKEATVRVSTSMPTTFMALAGVDSIRLEAKATARRTDPKHCLYALDPRSSGSVMIRGAGKVSVRDCGIQVNSASAAALQQSGPGKVEAETISVAGGYTGHGFTDAPEISKSLIGDPLEDLPEPVIPSGCNYANRKVSDVTIRAGRVFCDHIMFDGNVVFSPGMYYFRNAVVSIGGTARLSGTGVTFFVDSRSSLVQATGAGSIDLSAPAVGTYAGIAILGGRAAVERTPVISFTGNAGYVVKGTIYAPRHLVRITGAASPASDMQSNWIVAWQLAYTGDSDITFSGTDAPVPEGLARQKVALVR